MPGVDGESGSSMAAPSDRTDAESSIDLDWEHEPGMTPVPRTKQQILDDFTQLALGMWKHCWDWDCKSMW